MLITNHISTENFLASPIFEKLRKSERVLIAGAGGGFDIFAGVPLFLALRDAGKSVSLANLSFTNLRNTTAAEMMPSLFHVNHQTNGEPQYFPEQYLAQWLRQNELESDVYCFERSGVLSLRNAYQHLASKLNIDTLILIDGGTDILMRGDEAGLGTPEEDMLSLAATAEIEVPTKIVSCLGFGIDAYHGVCHAHFLENVAALERLGGYLGAHSLHLSTTAVSMYRDAVEFAHAKMTNRQSIVNGSIVSALEGNFGDYHRNERARSSNLFINPLMSMYWHFDLDAVAKQSHYLHLLEQATTYSEIQLTIEKFRNEVSLRPRREIPV